MNSVRPAIALGRGARARSRIELSSGKHLIFPGLIHEECLQLFQLVGILCGEVVILGEVIGDVIEFPFVASHDIRHFGRAHEPRGLRRNRRGDPAIVVERAVTEHLEVLRLALRGSVRVRAVEGVSHAHAFDRFLGDAIDRLRRLDAGGFEDRRHDINDVVELAADATDILDVAGPGDAPCPAGCHRRMTRSAWSI